MNNMDFFLSGSIYIEASLKPSLCSAQDLGATGIILLWKNYFQILCFEQTGLTRRHQPLRPCVCNPASSINMNWRWQQSWPRIISFYNPAILVILNRQVLHLQTGWTSVEYLKTNIFVKSEHWRPIQMDSLFTKYLLQANWLWRWLLTWKEEMTRI